jgi:hypothetical protein
VVHDIPGLWPAQRPSYRVEPVTRLGVGWDTSARVAHREPTAQAGRCGGCTTRGMTLPAMARPRFEVPRPGCALRFGANAVD